MSHIILSVKRSLIIEHLPSRLHLERDPSKECQLFPASFWINKELKEVMENHTRQFIRRPDCLEEIAFRSVSFNFCSFMLLTDSFLAHRYCSTSFWVKMRFKSAIISIGHRRFFPNVEIGAELRCDITEMNRGTMKDIKTFFLEAWRFFAYWATAFSCLCWLCPWARHSNNHNSRQSICSLEMSWGRKSFGKCLIMMSSFVE